MNTILRLALLLSQIIFFSFIYMFLDDSHFSGINTLEEMIKTELLQKKINPVISSRETFVNSIKTKEDIEEIKEIEKKADEIVQDIEEENVVDSFTKPSIFQMFFKRMYFSFVTGTTLGYGDIYPYSFVCKSITILQLITSILLIIV